MQVAVSYMATSALHAVLELGIADRLRFWGVMERVETLRRLAECDALVHPSLHDSGGVSCLEAMAAGRPVICLDVGGPHELATDDTGFRISTHTPADTVRRIASAMTAIANDAALRSRMGRAARERVASDYLWHKKGQLLDRLYRRVGLGDPELHAVGSR